MESIPKSPEPFLRAPEFRPINNYNASRPGRIYDSFIAGGMGWAERLLEECGGKILIKQEKRVG